MENVIVKNKKGRFVSVNKDAVGDLEVIKQGHAEFEVASMAVRGEGPCCGDAGASSGGKALNRDSEGKLV
jgi:hypothetical protein